MARNGKNIILICLIAIQLVLLIWLDLLAEENSKLKHKLKISIERIASKPWARKDATSSIDNTSVASAKTYANLLFDNKVPHPRPFSPSEVTILWLKRRDSALEAKMKNIKLLLPKAPIKFVNADGNLGKSLNHMIAEVQTQYFFLLEADATFSDRTNENIARLWDILELYPEVDFIGGSYLSGEKLYVSCQRFKLCKWTLKESYEYQRSLDNAMICEGTSASFMGRTKSVSKLRGGFDEKISDLLVIKDFFIQAKSVNVVVATLPNFVLFVDRYKSLYDLWQSRDITKEVISFAVKHKVLIFEDEEGNSIDLCATTSPISGKSLCIESITHQVMLEGGHWAYDGLYTYPFLLRYLKASLKEITQFLEEHNVNYTVIGGVALGAVKMHSILPWEAGDIDIYAFGMDVSQLFALLKPWGAKMGYVVRKHAEAVHVYCTPKEVGDVSGGLVTIFPFPLSRAPKYMRIKTDGIWVRYKRDLFQQFKKLYGNGYLTHKMYKKNDVIHCKKKDHNACLANFMSIFDGRGGTYEEYFNCGN